MGQQARVVIVGAGHAGGAAAAFLRRNGYAGEILLMGEEPVAPYHRPPLSKGYLTGGVGAASLRLKSEAFYRDHDIRLRLGVRVAALARSAREVILEDGERIAYGALVLATGSAPRTLAVSGSDLPGVQALRTVADADDLKTTLARSRRLALVGGGYIGLEIAAAARATGAEVVILEREAALLTRTASPQLAAFFAAYHRARGVEILTDAQVAGFAGSAESGVTGVLLADGSEIGCDAAVVGIGALARDDLARGAGLRCEAGIVVDGNARTGDPLIYAIGDVTSRPLTYSDGRMVRLESVQNALEQARQVAAALTGTPAPAPEVPWFWSDQYDLKLQIAGIPNALDDMVLRGSKETAEFSVFYLKNDRVQAVEAVNSARDFLAGKQLVAKGTPVSREKLADARLSPTDTVA